MKNVLYVLVLVVSILGSYYSVYRLGMLSGTIDVTAEWAEENKRRDAAYKELEDEYALSLATHSKREQKLSEKIYESEQEFENLIAATRNEYLNRVRSIETRAGVYQRQAQGSAEEQQRLASHAARLDRSLEEGRALVRELGETVRQRDNTIRNLGQIILNDRTLFSGDTNGY